MSIGSETLRLVAELRDAVARIIDEVTRRLTQAWVRAWDRLEWDFTRAAVDLIEASRDGRWPTRAQVERAGLASRALEAAARTLSRLVQIVQAAVRPAARDAARVGGTAQAPIIGSQFPPQADPAAVAARLGRFSDHALDAITRRTEQQITSLTRPLSAEATDAMKQELVRGVHVGENPREAARRMVRRVEGEFNGGLSRALNIARTEMIDSHRAAAAAGQATNRDVLRGWVWHARLDTRSCPACFVMHGTVHPVEEPGPLGHQQCRCSRTPLTRSWRDLGFDIDEPTSVIPDAQAVFRGLPRADQLAIMGPERLAALDRGAIGWADLARRRENPGWRPSYVPTPVRDLPRRRAA